MRLASLSFGTGPAASIGAGLLLYFSGQQSLGILFMGVGVLISFLWALAKIIFSLR